MLTIKLKVPHKGILMQPPKIRAHLLAAIGRENLGYLRWIIKNKLYLPAAARGTKKPRRKRRGCKERRVIRFRRRSA